MTTDSLSIAGNELLSYFGRNTAVTVKHQYIVERNTFDRDVLIVASARTNNVLAHITLSESEMDFTRHGKDFSANPAALAFLAGAIMAQKSFPKNRKMNKSWSPIRFSAQAQAMMESDSGIRFN